jgi:hypothetical protein
MKYPIDARGPLFTGRDREVTGYIFFVIPLFRAFLHIPHKRKNVITIQHHLYVKQTFMNVLSHFTPIYSNGNYFKSDILRSFLRDQTSAYALVYIKFMYNNCCDVLVSIRNDSI